MDSRSVIPQVVFIMKCDVAQRVRAFDRCLFGVMAKMLSIEVFLQGPFAVKGFDSTVVQQLRLTHAKYTLRGQANHWKSDRCTPRALHPWRVRPLGHANLANRRLLSCAERNNGCDGSGPTAAFLLYITGRKIEECVDDVLPFAA
jgi:hypothetical protein